MSLSKNQVKYIKSLHQPKFRQMYENFIAEGEKVVIELLRNFKFEIELIAVKVSFYEKNVHFLTPLQDKLFIIDNEQMEQISALKSVTDVLIVAKQSEENFKKSLNDNFIAFYLDGIQDPGNLGTIIRIADWYGIDFIIRSEDSADFFSPKVVQSSMGSICNVNLSTMKREEIVEIKGPTFYGLDMIGNDLDAIEFANQSIFVLGNEGKGISKELKNKVLIQNSINIKGHKNRIAESLNVSVTAGILANKIFSINK